ncbi:MarR family winged helix-turn-helix transcriptional regulator [Paracoccus sp. (in: a-proteobacteria)]|uniref:MarR family winged helix-turn-helix transcriptional regulator n=1 Tax=Paracoccus sp. TaxID=267 RepID=UPI00289E9365|nr:MarR family winged helix-turn-helix transcriptional regulator [Paracoccus sp. (in: a-proteobacteria)]
MEDETRRALHEARAGRDRSDLPYGDQGDAPMQARLWENPCWFSFRLNYLALRFNNPVYGFIQSRLDLLRPDFVVLWSLYLGGESAQTDVVRTSGFPKNTLSRAVNKVHRLGMIERETDPLDLRRVTLRLTDKGRAAVDEVKAEMMGQERLMLESLSPAERSILSEILTKLVIASADWPETLASETDQNSGQGQ